MRNDRLLHLCDHLIARLTGEPDLAIAEGRVGSLGPPPYRRLDCRGRALAYLRPRARRGAVRLDIPILWIAREPTPLRVESRSGGAALLVRSPAEIDEAVRFIRAVVERTRRQEDRCATRKAG